MKPRRIRFTATAQHHLEREHAWWLDNRTHASVFLEEFEQALKVVSLLPGAGTQYRRSPVPGVRRVYLGRLGLHLYYTFDAKEVLIRAVWGAQRDRGPELV